jgi:hypothetical protein
MASAGGGGGGGINGDRKQLGAGAFRREERRPTVLLDDAPPPPAPAPGRHGAGGRGRGSAGGAGPGPGSEALAARQHGGQHAKPQQQQQRAGGGPRNPGGAPASTSAPEWREATPPASASSSSRLERAVLCSEMWVDECAAAGEAAMGSDPIPLEFGSAQQYIATFGPLLHEEAREGVRNAWQVRAAPAAPTGGVLRLLCRRGACWACVCAALRVRQWVWDRGWGVAGGRGGAQKANAVLFAGLLHGRTGPPSWPAEPPPTHPPPPLWALYP